jgi:hypothetical protein
MRVEWDVDRKLLAFYTWCCTCKKYKDRMGHVDREPLAFCTWCCVCKKYKDRTGHRSGAPRFGRGVERVKSIMIEQGVDQEPHAFCTL